MTIDMIETERLVLRRWKEDDAAALYGCASDGRVSRLVLWPRHTSVEMSREVIMRFFLPNPHVFAIVPKDSDNPIGCIGLVPDGDEHYVTAPAEREVGYWIAYPCWGKGLTTEALKGFISYCRTELRLESLLITTDSRNMASRRVAEKCGFEFTGDYVLDGIQAKAYRLKLETAL